MKRILTVILLLSLMLCNSTIGMASDAINCWFPPAWKSKGAEAKAITSVLSEKSGIMVNPRIAQSYPEILQAFSTGDKNLVYVGSFVQAIIKARHLGTPLAQLMDGKQLYAGVLIYPEGQDPTAILKNNPADISYAVGASSGESAAKAATSGKASIPTPNHGASVGAVKAGKAKAAVVKNWWWQANKDKYPGMAMYEMPGISIVGNPDNVLTASNAVPADMAAKIKEAALSSSAVFGKGEMKPFNGSALDFSLALMKKGNIDPMTYTW